MSALGNAVSSPFSEMVIEVLSANAGILGKVRIFLQQISYGFIKSHRKSLLQFVVNPVKIC